jgi:hypothetical protein
VLCNDISQSISPIKISGQQSRLEKNLNMHKIRDPNLLAIDSKHPHHTHPPTNRRKPFLPEIGLWVDTHRFRKGICSFPVLIIGSTILSRTNGMKDMHICKITNGFCISLNKIAGKWFNLGRIPTTQP